MIIKKIIASSSLIIAMSAASTDFSEESYGTWQAFEANVEWRGKCVDKVANEQFPSLWKVQLKNTGSIEKRLKFTVPDSKQTISLTLYPGDFVVIPEKIKSTKSCESLLSLKDKS